METNYQHILKMRSCWSSRLSKAILLLLFPYAVSAQFSEPDASLPKNAGIGNYLFPINPGRPNQLAGTMGELRNTHFHGGIDIRTDNQIGVPVLATQDGYISRASVGTAGYGRVLYLSHPDGKTSVYGHLDRYKGKIAKYVKEEQYRRKTFEIDLLLSPEEFPVKRGDTIALSGNTGGSSGPHLHFEIRDGNYVLNPLKFGFTEIKDNIAPTAQKIALRTLDINSRINDQFGRFEFTLVKKSASEYVLPIPILATGRIGVELLAEDRMDDSPARCGINYIEMFADSQKVFTQHIERVDLEETRGILAVVDFKTMEIRGKRFNKLYIDDGNRLDFYKNAREGIITVKDSDRSIRILLRDESGNKSNARFQLKNNPMDTEMLLPAKKVIGIESDLFENSLIVSSSFCSDSDKLTIFSNGKATEVPFNYASITQRVYLIDLRKSQPDSVKTCRGSLVFHFKDIVPSTTIYTYYSDWADVRFPENSLYDTLYLNTNHRAENKKESFVIGQRTIPLHKNVLVTLKPDFQLTPSKDLAVYRREGNSASYLGGEWAGSKVRFSTRELGEFVFLRDTVPPVITKVRIDNQSARLRIRDGLSGISYYEANINGQWLLMIYDYKTGILQSDRLDLKQPLKGDFELKVVDRAGNERIFKQKI
ncbi:MAG: M23 family metallopeptidase [Cyclobacteriaceae bacterium]|nr:M23 family metallopeptidase [Cyclobacteriaceae bacterium]